MCIDDRFPLISSNTYFNIIVPGNDVIIKWLRYGIFDV